MPMRRTIGISLACLVTSACAIAETSEENTPQSISVTPENAETPTDRSPSFACAAAQERRSADYRSERVAHPSASFEPVTDVRGSVLHPCCGLSLARIAFSVRIRSENG